MQISQWLLIFVLIIITDAEHNIQKRDSSNKKKIVCYYTNWSVYRPGTAKFSPQNINPYLCTHLIYAFGGLDKENGLKPYDKYQDIEQGGYAKFNGLKTYNKNLKTLLAIGGWNEGSTRFSKLVADEDRRKEFVKNVVKFLRQNNFDGLDLDWEYPSFRDGSNPSDKENYALLVKELREEFNKESSKTGRSRLLLTMAVPAGIEYIDKGYDIPELNKYLDFMNLLTYDYHSAYEPAVNHHSPLYPLEEDSEYNFDAKLNIDHTIKHYLDSGADKDKLVLGIPTYGRSYTLFNKESTGIGAPSDGPGEKGEATREKGYLSYYEICGSLKKDDKWTVEQPKPRAMGPYAYKDNQWVGYDDEEFVKLKAKYVNEHELGGIMFWSIDNDDFRGSCHKRPYPLIEAGKSALLGFVIITLKNVFIYFYKIYNVFRNLKVDSTLTKETKTPLKQRPKQRPISRSTTTESEEISSVSTTPEPPTTPDSGTDFTCKEEGFFPHPRECKKYFWCLDSGPSNLGIVAHQFTCPSGLVFNKLSDSCDYSRNVICKDKITTSDVTTITTTTSTSKPIKSGLKITTTTTTTSTQAPEIEEEVDSEFEEEDPKEIKQLITLIKKLGGVAELEKQLNLKDGDTEVTTPTISKTLYNKVLKNPANRFQSRYVNGPGPQSNGLEVKDDTPDYKKDKPQYVTIRRQRPSKDVEEENLNVEDANSEHDVTTEQTKLTYKSVDRNRYRDLEESSNKNEENDSIPKYISINQSRSTESDSQDTTSPKYVTLRRSRPTTQAEESIDEETSLTTLPSTSSPKYVSLLRQRSTTTPSKHEERVIEVTTIKEEDDEIRDIITTPKIRRDRNRFRGTRPPIRTTTAVEEPQSSTESYVAKVNRRRKFRPEYTTVVATTKYSQEEPTTIRSRRPEQRRIKNRTTTLKNIPTTIVTPETVAEDSKQINDFLDSSSQPFYDESSFFSKNRDDRKIGGPVEDLANTAVAAIHTLATAPPSTTIYRSSTSVPEKTFFQEPQHQELIVPRLPHSKDNVFNLQNEFTKSLQQQPQQQTLQQLSPSIKLSESLQQQPPKSFQPVASGQFHPSPFQSGPFQPIPFSSDVSFSPPPVFAPQQPTTPLPATSRQTFLLRRGPSRTTPLIKFTPTTARSLVPVQPIQFLNDGPNQEQFADYSEQSNSGEQVALKGKVRIHADGYIECLDMGSFPHPFSCQKFISCSKTEYGSLIGWEYTCPKGLSFDPVGGICNWSNGCNN
ncbi:uncharacterized protein LOC126895227 isoform X3 [Daktulosphaira vitifoliae]|uniref:uncharacterized protein LOC126895227 isoform X3 n=1 Tax=Daktulosphaira vitifoliae TaxID=58002 RepID=UPI0021A9AC68|nr:uncharacterized protein LOC126895227 isoform X3 [Daktulosphaira vitifoliae]